jgi:hypothetical protein
MEMKRMTILASRQIVGPQGKLLFSFRMVGWGTVCIDDC